MTKKGLTLIELLGVIIVLGIIAAISFPAINGVINNSRKDAVLSNANAMVEAAETFANDEILRNADFSQLPTNEVGLIVDDSKSIKVSVVYLQAEGHLENKFAGEGYVVLVIDTNNEVKVTGVVFEEGEFSIEELPLEGKLVRSDVNEAALASGAVTPVETP